MFSITNNQAGYQHVCDFPKFGIQTIFGAQLQSLLRNLAAVCCKQSKTMFGQVFKLMMTLNLFYTSYHLLIDGLVFFSFAKNTYNPIGIFPRNSLVSVITFFWIQNIVKNKWITIQTLHLLEHYYITDCSIHKTLTQISLSGKREGNELN